MCLPLHKIWRHSWPSRCVVGQRHSCTIALQFVPSLAAVLHGSLSPPPALLLCTADQDWADALLVLGMLCGDLQKLSVLAAPEGCAMLAACTAFAAHLQVPCPAISKVASRCESAGR